MITSSNVFRKGSFYNINFKGEASSPTLGIRITSADQVVRNEPVKKSDYAYLIDWNDRSSAALLNALQEKGMTLATSMREYSVSVDGKTKLVNYGSLMLPVAKQSLKSDEIFKIISEGQKKYNVDVLSRLFVDLISSKQLNN